MHKLALSLLLTAATAAHGVTYNFESLGFGSLTGQDGWVNAGTGLDLQVQTGIGINGTRTLFSPATANPNVAHRLNDGNFSFGTILGTETALIIEGDFRFDTALGSSGDFFIMLIGNAGVAGPQIGFTPFGVFLRDAGYGTGITVLPGTLNDGDWMRLRLELDLTANLGNGSADVYYQNLTDLDVGFTPVVGMQDIDVNIAGAGAAPAGWNRLRIDGRSGNSATGGFDNFTVIVPEPGSALFLATGFLLTALRRWRR